jgi:RNA polymerase sigma-70 factor (ECF subfamily)
MKDINHRISLLKQKDKQVIGYLYDDYGGPILGIISRIVQDANKAEELLQDTFVRAWDRGNLYDETKGSLFTWLVRIARNLSINEVQSKAFKKKQVTGTLDPAFDGHQQELSVNTLGLKGHVSRLDNKYMEVIDLVYFQGHTHQEAAHQLDLPLGTLKSRIKKAIEALRKVYI